MHGISSLTVVAALALQAYAQSGDKGLERFRATYKELVETKYHPFNGRLHAGCEAYGRAIEGRRVSGTGRAPVCA